jgi:hypothetical protein
MPSADDVRLDDNFILSAVVAFGTAHLTVRTDVHADTMPVVIRLIIRSREYGVLRP